MKVEFLTAQYEFAHGRLPRGFGSWFFKFEGREFWAHGCLYGEAKKRVREEIARVAPKGYTHTVLVNVET